MYDVSPLPKDEIPVHKSESSASGLGDLQVPLNILNKSEEDVSPDVTHVSPDVTQNTVTPPIDANSTCLSHADSLYYTPDITTEKLSDITTEKMSEVNLD